MVTEYRDRLLVEAFRLCGNQADAEDLVGSVFKEVFAHNGGYDPEKGELYSYLSGILSHLYARSKRRAVNRGTVAVDPSVLAEDESLATSCTDDEIFSHSDHDALREAIQRLPSDYRDAVLLHYFSELPIVKVARILGISDGTVKWRLSMARKALADDLGRGLSGLKKPLAVLAMVLFGVTALFGAYKAGLVDALIEKWNDSADVASEEGVDVLDGPQATDNASDERFDLKQESTARETQDKENTMNIGKKAVVGLATVVGLASAPVLADGGAQDVIQMPADYAQLEWIRSTGTQYIDTGVEQTKDLRVSCTMLPGAGRQSGSTTESAILGAAWTAWGYLAIFHGAELRFYTLNGCCPFAALSEYGNGEQKIDLVYRYDRFVVNGNAYFLSAAWDESKVDRGPVHLFDAYDAQSPARRGAFTLYKAKMEAGETVLRDFVPAVQLSTGARGLLDVAHLDDLEQAFYPNLGDGSDFVAGPRVVFCEDVPPQTYTGLPIVPEIKVFEKSNGQTVRLTEGADYEVEMQNNVIGPATVRIVGLNDYAGSEVWMSFEIRTAADDRIRLVGVESRVVMQEGDAVLMPGLKVLDKNGTVLDPSCYTVNVARPSADALSLLVVTITSGPYAGAQTSARFRQAVIPQGYQILDGLTSTGTQYFDTGISPSDDLTVTCVLTADPDFVSEHAVFGAEWTERGFFNMFYNGQHRWNSHGGFAEVAVSSSTLAGDPVSIVCKPDELSVDGVTCKVQGQEKNTAASIRVFDGYRFPDKRGHFTLHRLQMVTDGGLYLRDFVPVRKSDGTLGFYDTAHPDAGDRAFYVDLDGTAEFVAGNPLADFALGEIPAQDFVPGGCRPTVTVMNRRTGEILPSEDFTCAYSNCDKPGVGIVTVEGNADTPYEGQVARAQFRIRMTAHVDPGKSGDDGDGLSWEHPVSLARAMTLIESTGGEIWLKEGRHVLPESLPIWNQTQEVTVRGGFVGTEDSAADRPAESVTTLDGEDVKELISVNNSCAMTFERICFSHGAAHGFAKVGGAGDLLLERCRLLSNGAKNAAAISGRGGSFAGNAAATVTLRNCSVEGNIGPIDGNNYGANGHGYGLFFSGLGSAVIEHCEFITNGFDFARVAGVEVSDARGAAIFSDGVKVRASDCRFVGNILYSASQGAIVFLDGGAGGSQFDHCLWRGNRDAAMRLATGDDGCKGMLAVSLDLPDQTVDIKGCTFAYNLGGVFNGAAGVNVRQGTVRVRDSIFYGNALPKDSTTDCDVAVLQATGSARMEISYTLFDHNPSSANVVCDHLTIGDPLFVTPVSEFIDCTYLDKSPRSEIRPPKEMSFRPEKLSEVLAMNVHVRGGSGYLDEKTGVFVGAYAKRKSKVRSPAIDAGDPASSFALETKPRGGRVNLGCYGNTPYQTQSTQGMILLLK